MTLRKRLLFREDAIEIVDLHLKLWSYGSCLQTVMIVVLGGGVLRL